MTLSGQCVQPYEEAPTSMESYEADDQSIDLDPVTRLSSLYGLL
jgi:hypothetical protein